MPAFALLITNLFGGLFAWMVAKGAKKTFMMFAVMSGVVASYLACFLAIKTAVLAIQKVEVANIGNSVALAMPDNFIAAMTVILGMHGCRFLVDSSYRILMVADKMN